LLQKLNESVDCYLISTLLSTCDLLIPTKFHQIKPPRRSYDVKSISQDGGHGVANLIPVKPVACLVTSLVWYISVYGWDITYFWFPKTNKRPPYWKFTSDLQSDHMLPFLIPPSFVDVCRFTPKLLAFIENRTWRRPPSWICNTVLLDYPRSRVGGGPKKHLRRVILVVSLRDKVPIFNRSQGTEGVQKF